MASEEETKQAATVLINGQEYNQADLTQQQIYLIQQITDLDGKIRSNQFNLDQTSIARGAFMAQLNASLEPADSAEKKEAAVESESGS